MTSPLFPLLIRVSLRIVRTAVQVIARFGTVVPRWDRKYGLRERKKPSLISSKEPPLSFALWVHAPSLGEWEGARRFLSAFASVCSESGVPFFRSIVCSTQRVSVRDRLLLRPPLDGLPTEVTLYPLDSPEQLARLWKRCGVRLAVVYESDLWPGTAEASRLTGIPLWWVSARLTPLGMARWLTVPGLYSRMVGGCDRVWGATYADSERISSLAGKSIETGGDDDL